MRDVTLVDEEAKWELHILAGEASVGGVSKKGVVLSLVILSPFDNQFLSIMLQEKWKQFGTYITKDLYEYLGHSFSIGSKDDLRSLCVELVADFDSKHLELWRKAHREVMKELKQKKP